MANEVFGGKPHPDFKNTVRGQPKRINEKMIGKAFGIITEEEDAFGKGDNQALSFFPSQSISHTYGWQVKQCTNLEFRLVLAYLNPLFYPQKPQRVTVQIASTIAACLFSVRKTNWARASLKIISKEVARTQKTPTSLLCYLVHLYKHLDLLTPDERKDYESHMEAMEGGDPDQKEADHSNEEFEEDNVREVVGPVIQKK
jgi:hypothetical protein